MAAKPPTDMLAHVIYLQGELAAGRQKWDEVEARMDQVAHDFPIRRWDCRPPIGLPKPTIAKENSTKRASGWRRWRSGPPGATIPGWRWFRCGGPKCWPTETMAEAQAIASQIQRDFPNFAQQYEADYLLGRALAAQADFDGARREYQKVIRSHHRRQDRNGRDGPMDDRRVVFSIRKTTTRPCANICGSKSSTPIRGGKRRRCCRPASARNCSAGEKKPPSCMPGSSKPIPIPSLQKRGHAAGCTRSEIAPATPATAGESIPTNRSVDRNHRTRYAEQTRHACHRIARIRRSLSLYRCGFAPIASRRPIPRPQWMLALTFGVSRGRARSPSLQSRSHWPDIAARQRRLHRSIGQQRVRRPTRPRRAAHAGRRPAPATTASPTSPATSFKGAGKRDSDAKSVQHRPRRRLGDAAAAGLLVHDAGVRFRANDQLAARPRRAGAIRHTVSAATERRPARSRRRSEGLPGKRQPRGPRVRRGGEKMGPARRSKSSRRSSTPANASSTNCGATCACSTASPRSARCSACWARSAA